MGARSILQLPSISALTGTEVVHANQSLFDKQMPLAFMAQWIMQQSAYAPLLVPVSGNYTVPTSGPCDVWLAVTVGASGFSITLPAIAAAQTPMRVFVSLIGAGGGTVSVIATGLGTYNLSVLGDGIILDGTKLTAAPTYGWRIMMGQVQAAASIATVSAIMRRDVNGRAQVVDPSAAADIATKNYVDTQDTAHANLTTAHGAVSTATASKMMVRDAAGRASVADPSASTDIATKNYVDATAGTSAATASALMRRDAAGRAQVATPSAAADIVTKSYADANVLGAAPGSGWATVLAAALSAGAWVAGMAGIAPPVGFVYIQGPNDTAPGTLYPGTTWSDVSPEEGGGVRRMKGGASPNIGPAQGANQTDALEVHYHSPLGSHTSIVQGIASGGGISFPGGTYADYTNVTVPTTGAAITDGTHVLRSDIETRGYGFGVTKWRRTS